MSQAPGLEALTRAYRATGNGYYLDVASQALPVFTVPLAVRLFATGNAEAMDELPRFDTGAWSLYQPGIEDDLSYHQLVTGFLAQLCALTRAPVYCATAAHFRSYARMAPALQQLTFRGPERKPVTLGFRVSKISRVGLVVTQGPTTSFATSAVFPYGVSHFMIPRSSTPARIRSPWPPPISRATSRATGTLQITR